MLHSCGDPLLETHSIVELETKKFDVRVRGVQRRCWVLEEDDDDEEECEV